MAEEPPDDQWIEQFLAEEPERVRKLLAAVIKASGQSQRELEKRLRWTRGTISNVLRGRIELRQLHVTGIVLAAGFEPARFYRLAHPRRLLLGHVLSADDFEARLKRLGALPELPPEPLPEPRLPQTLDELRQFVAEAVRQAMRERHRAKRKRAPSKKTPSRKKK